MKVMIIVKQSLFSLHLFMTVSFDNDYMHVPVHLNETQPRLVACTSCIAQCCYTVTLI